MTTVKVKIPKTLPPIHWQKSPNYSSRHGAAVSLVVVHDTAARAGTPAPLAYQGAIAWLCNPEAQASAHVVLNAYGTEATQIVAWNDKAWAVVAFNPISDNIEMTHSDGGRWITDQIRVAARIVAFRLHKRGLPPRYVGSRVTLRGYTRHKDLGIAGGGHTDPQMTAIQWRFMRACIWYEYHRGRFRKSWGRNDP